MINSCNSFINRFWRVISAFAILLAMIAAAGVVYLFELPNEQVWPVLILFFAAIFAGWTLSRPRRACFDHKQAVREFEQIFNKSLNGMLLIDRDYKILLANDSFFSTLKISDNEKFDILSNHRKCFDISATSFCKSSNCPAKKVFETGESAKREMTLHDSEGRELACIVSATPFKVGENGVESVLMDIKDATEKIENEKKFSQYRKQIRTVASELSMAEERERRRLAVNLHDSVSQTLFVAKMQIGAMLKDEKRRNDTASIKELHDNVDAVLAQTRTLLFELSPPALYELGLEYAVEGLCEKLAKKHNLQISFVYDKCDRQMEMEIKVLLFQVIRELLNNVVKHSQATRVLVHIKPGNQYVRCTVEDNGVGFDSNNLNRYVEGNAGFGLFNLKERLGHFEGNLMIGSETGVGTRATVIAPFEVCAKTQRDGGKDAG